MPCRTQGVRGFDANSRMWCCLERPHQISFVETLTVLVLRNRCLRTQFPGLKKCNHRCAQLVETVRYTSKSFQESEILATVDRVMAVGGSNDVYDEFDVGGFFYVGFLLVPPW